MYVSIRVEVDITLNGTAISAVKGTLQKKTTAASYRFITFLFLTQFFLFFKINFIINTFSFYFSNIVQQLNFKNFKMEFWSKYYWYKLSTQQCRRLYVI